MFPTNGHGLTRPRALLAAIAASALAVTGLVAGAAGSNAAQPAPVSIRGAGNPNAIPGSYIVVLSSQTTRAQTRVATQSLAASYDVKVKDQYDSSIKGFSATMSEDQAKKLAGDSRVAYVQQNQKITVAQDDPPWGLDRADQRDLPLDKKYVPSTDAKNVNVYIIDTGIYAKHNDFGDRASVGTDTVGDGQNGVDCMGHGSHVAGTIGGTTYGLAKAAKLIAVRVLDCKGSGSTESVVAGIDWVTKNAKKPAVANMSLGGGADDALDAAVKASVDAGVTYAVAAGNDNADACQSSPAKEPSAITVGATDDQDQRAVFSNFGKCVDLFAPGVDITSVGITGPDATAKMSGTSMATPHVAGGIALYLADHPDATPAEVAKALVANSTADKVGGPGTGSPNKLLYVGAADQS
ncbi:subtilisin family serine protease [Kribbella aluminosa]|uniref:Subtilisin family serine protease n=1 Tax=Kribbella aluminosa TaxID=416017 RepID=A0ABS4UM35_9ACTN|nr:S8 family peptidase [Kribbella aluminosa]MBP2352707.1 subtilisin family serine protease [Kribbella aluminosa]